MVAPGEKYGRWTVLTPAEHPNGREAFLCKCACGTERVVMTQSLLRKDRANPSCGCWRREQTARQSVQMFTKHGQTGTPLYRLWKRVRRRCYSEDAHNYKHYGGRGIGMYDEWRDDAGAFIRWVEANLGPRPAGKTLDRIDNDGNYEPGNLRWATQAQQNANKRAPNGYPAPS